MANEPYKTKLSNCMECLQNQTAAIEILICEHEIAQYFRLNEVLNMGVEQAAGDFLWICGADFIIEDPTLLERMNEKVEADGLDCIFVMYLSPAYKKYKVSDGSVFMRREVMERFGRFDDSLIGISRATFVFLEWCMENTRWHASRDFLITLDHSDRRRARIHQPTLDKCNPSYKRVIKKLGDMGLWLN